MRKKIAIIGVILIMLGIAMSLGGFMIIDKAPTATSISPYTKGEYNTSCIYITGGDRLIVANPGSHSGLIPYKDLSKVTSSNLHNYSEPEHGTSSSMEFTGLNQGTYVFVIFSSVKPANFGYSLESPSEFFDLEFADYAFNSGILIFIGGIVVSLIGLILKPKNNKIKPILKHSNKK
ncbi:MAG: hypothetical protein QXZ44_01965 [Ferroplasma sp.]